MEGWRSKTHRIFVYKFEDLAQEIINIGDYSILQPNNFNVTLQAGSLPY